MVATVEPLFELSVDSRRDGSAAFFRTVFIRNRTFPSPFFSFSAGAQGPSGAGELMNSDPNPSSSMPAGSDTIPLKTKIERFECELRQWHGCRAACVSRVGLGCLEPVYVMGRGFGIVVGMTFPSGFGPGKQCVATKGGERERQARKAMPLGSEWCGKRQRKRSGEGHGSGVVRCQRLARIFSHQRQQMETRRMRHASSGVDGRWSQESRWQAATAYQ